MQTHRSRDDQKAALLALAKSQDGCVSTVQAHAVSLKYTGRISDLRKEGWQIDCERREDGNNLYRFVRKNPKQIGLDLGKQKHLEFIGKVSGMDFYEVAR